MEKQLDLIKLLDYIDPGMLDHQDQEKKYYIYKHTAPNGKVYIGMTSKNPQERWDSGHGYRKHKYFWNAIKKYGWNNINHEILYDGLTKDEACQLEINLINLYDSTDHQKGYNLSTGGKGGSAGTVLANETKKKMSLSRSGTRHPMYGKHHTKETKIKLSKLNSREKHPQYGSCRSEKTKEKLRKANSGENHPMFGTHHTDEHKKKISLASPLQKPVICLETGTIYRSAAEASRQTKVNQSHIGSCCRGYERRKTAGGYHWAYAEE